MGIIRESSCYNDNPRHSNILFDNIDETITIISKAFDDVTTIDVFDYDQYEEFLKSGLMGTRIGKKLRNEYLSPE